jgi:hypothetical protein
MIHQYSTHSRRKEPVPFFPCYLFVQIDPASPEYLSLRAGLRGFAAWSGSRAGPPGCPVASLPRSKSG